MRGGFGWTVDPIEQIKITNGPVHRIEKSGVGPRLAPIPTRT